MSKTLKAQVNEHHFKGHVNIGEKTLTKTDEKTVEDSNTLRNLVREGTVKVTQGSLRPERDEKEFQEDDRSGENSEKDAGKDSLKDLTVDELKEKCEDLGLKKSGTKDELVERLKNSE